MEHCSMSKKQKKVFIRIEKNNKSNYKNKKNNDNFVYSYCSISYINPRHHYETISCSVILSNIPLILPDNICKMC